MILKYTVVCDEEYVEGNKDTAYSGLVDGTDILEITKRIIELYEGPREPIKELHFYNIADIMDDDGHVMEGYTIVRL